MTLSDPAAPGGEKLPLAELNGALLLINVRDQLKDVATEFGPTDPISADVYVLDGDHKGESFEDTLIFPKVLVSSLKTKVGDWVQARLGQGIAKPGRSAPWLLNTISDDDKKVCAAAHARLTAPVEIEGF
jgi:hypothetical protein